MGFGRFPAAGEDGRSADDVGADFAEPQRLSGGEVADHEVGSGHGQSAEDRVGQQIVAAVLEP
ncbi:hypothetical protein ACFCW6_08880 [Streptomyces sp. NPDC056333]|uniref:hypothetical protein n=1 Tax=Streptomyces sp. NPDC056333 TaxID=3345786 RepID=UPI0035E103DC